MSSIDFAGLITRGVESDELDYKAHQSWNSMSRVAKAKFVRHLAAFANTRGGYLVVGVGEDEAGYPGVLQGLSAEESASFDPSRVGAFVKNHVEPPIDFVIERPVVDGKRFAVFVVKPFSALPHVCCQGVENELREGVFYIRTEDASSRPATRAMELHLLIQRSLRNQREMLGRMLRGILYENDSSSGTAVQSSSIAGQFKSAREYFVRRMKPAAESDYAFIQMTFVPDGELKCSAGKMLGIFHDFPMPGIPEFFSLKGKKSIHRISVGLRCMYPEKSAMWQFFENGCFLFTAYLEKKQNNTLDIEDVRAFAENCIIFASETAGLFKLEEKIFSVRMLVSGENETAISSDSSGIMSVPSSGATAEICRSAADLASAPDVHSARLIRKFSAGIEEQVVR